jgi:tetratricopeptide (TPR) repeat protein
MTPADDPPPGGQEKRRLKPTQGHWGRRKRRLRRVAWLLFGVALAALSIRIVIYRATRPEVRRPGEKLDDITQRLSRGLPQDAPEPRFTDVTDEAGLGDFVSFVGQRSSQLPEDMGSGVAWGDFDNDGDDDAFLVSAGGTLMLPPADWAASQLYENLGDATFRRVESFPELRISGMAAAWGDYNGDGWLDLVVTGYRSLVLFRNDRGRLLKDPALPELPGYWAGASWGDFDNDRDLDLYVCGYVIYVEDTTAAGGGASEQYGTSVPYTLNPASFEPESNLLFQNNGDGTFTEVAQLWGVSNPGGRSLGALWQDFDDDGRLDLYVANDISDNALFLNRGETFEDVSLAAWVADYRGAMGLATGDWNRDGDDDLFVTHWVAQENALYDSRLVDLQRARQLDAPRVDGDPAPALPLSFSDMAAPLGLGQIALQSVGWGTEFVDFDHDGWLDLVVANGSTLETDEVPKALKPQATMFLWNRRGEYFHDLASLNEIFSTPRVSRGLAVSDYDQDGDLDLLFMDLYDRARLLRNDMASANWLQIRLRSKGPGGELTGRGEGSKVLVRIADLELRRTVTGGSYLSQSSPTLHFGLGRATQVDRVEVRWHGGEFQSFAGLEGNTAWGLTEGEPVPRRIFGNSGPKTGVAADGSSEVSDRQRVLAFWEKQRAAMDAFKIEQDIPKAALLFAEALELDPGHEDSRYYLANCLAVQGEVEEAMRHLERLMEINPLSHRAYKQWGIVRAMTAESPADLDAAIRALERSLEINKEETGALLVLGELALMQGDEEVARQRLEWNTSTNPRSTGGLFLLGYLAWQRGESDLGADFLQRAKGTRGADWKPEGAVAEGDVASRMHREASPLSVFWERWDGNLDPSQAFQPLAAFLDQDQPWK